MAERSAPSASLSDMDASVAVSPKGASNSFFCVATLARCSAAKSLFSSTPTMAAQQPYYHVQAAIDGNTMTFLCPFCNFSHTHAAEGPFPTHRSPHCHPAKFPHDQFNGFMIHRDEPCANGLVQPAAAAAADDYDDDDDSV
jgi:hypothetical protein